MSWTITPKAKLDYIRLRHADAHGNAGFNYALAIELREDVDWVEQRKSGRPRRDGMLVYRGRKSRRYQYVVDPRTEPYTLIEVRPEHESDH